MIHFVPFCISNGSFQPLHFEGSASGALLEGFEVGNVGGVEVSHHFFMNDILLFCEATKE